MTDEETRDLALKLAAILVVAYFAPLRLFPLLSSIFSGVGMAFLEPQLLAVVALVRGSIFQIPFDLPHCPSSNLNSSTVINVSC